MDVDAILTHLNEAETDYLLIGGVNFLLRHAPELTFDVDVWVRDDEANLSRLNGALQSMKAEWGPIETAWAPVPADWHWLRQQTIYCLTTPYAALDIFREVRGLEGRYDECRTAAVSHKTATGVAFWGLSDEQMLASQEALEPADQKPRRIEILRRAMAAKQR